MSILDVYIHDYLLKRKLHATAKAFQSEAKVSTDPVAIDAPGGFLFEWWSVFWDVFIARTRERHSSATASYVETQITKAREMQQQQQFQKPQQQQQMQMSQLILQRHIEEQQQQQQQQQQQRRGRTRNFGSTPSGLEGKDRFLRQNSGTASAVAMKVYEENLKLSLPRDSLEDAAFKQRFGDNVGLLDPSITSVLKTASLCDQPPGYSPSCYTNLVFQANPAICTKSWQGNSSADSKPKPARVFTGIDAKRELNALPMLRAAAPEGILVGIHGLEQGGNNLPLKGWRLTGLEQLRAGLIQQQKPWVPPLQHSQLQLQQQLLLQAQQNLTPQSVVDLDMKRLRLLLDNQQVGLRKDALLNSIGELGLNNEIHKQVDCPASPHGDQDLLVKLEQPHHQQEHQFPQHPLSSQRSQTSVKHPLQPEQLDGSSGITVDGSTSNTFLGNDQASKSHIGRKRKQPVSSSEPANSAGTANIAGPSLGSTPSTPSVHTAGDVISMPLSQKVSTCKSMLMFCCDDVKMLPPQRNQLADVDHLAEGVTIDDNVESCFSLNDTHARDAYGKDTDAPKSFKFKELRVVPASTSQIECCDFSSDGKLLAAGGQDKKAVLWCTESLRPMFKLEEHHHTITDIRFSPRLPRLATSSFDKTVRVWDCNNVVRVISTVIPAYATYFLYCDASRLFCLFVGDGSVAQESYSCCTLTAHSTCVKSVDFHPTEEGLLCSCDRNGEIRYWNISNGASAAVFEGGTNRVRFQPHLGRCLAASAGTCVSIFDVETHTPRVILKGHTSEVHSVCWHPSGEYLASVSDELVRVWKVGAQGEGKCVQELTFSGNKFYSCAFHPTHSTLLNLEIWDMTKSKIMSIAAHDHLISELAVSDVTGLVASASHDKTVKLWM
ncbi:LIS1 homology motif [Dillenia turbinata]|uniref:LIS1 homology motif n=1 Tax=Dillenia turbinata TaxID=194707 RepID=A0AAN8ZSA3_9MAGN